MTSSKANNCKIKIINLSSNKDPSHPLSLNIHFDLQDAGGECPRYKQRGPQSIQLLNSPIISKLAFLCVYKFYAYITRLSKYQTSLIFNAYINTYPLNKAVYQLCSFFTSENSLLLTCKHIIKHLFNCGGVTIRFNNDMMRITIHGWQYKSNTGSSRAIRQFDSMARN